ncbi:hypothetical protein KJ885_04250 [Patescibacteria group bacterium]|nr:hypothetical protein [Patescibacteria group bacterium]
MLSKDLQIKMFWLTELKKGNYRVTEQEKDINEFLENNPDIEIVDKDFCHRGACPFMIIWYRKIDLNWRERRGPEA